MSEPKEISHARALLRRAVPGLSDQAQIELAIELAYSLLQASQVLATRAERAKAARLQALMDDENGQVFATALTD
ncbi:MAG TPA: hypothetical protein VFU02_12035, partial [Polyangiaceae bacterium]|nr:hypothetical protein [Polyangiaceae bacterium]